MKALFLGDSVTAGWANDDVSDGWPYLFAARSGWEITNLAVGGSLLHDPLVTDQLSSSSRSILKQVPVNLSAFDLVIIDSGRNDVIEHGDEYTDYRLTPATRQVNPRSLEQPKYVLQDMVAQIRASGVEARVIGITPRSNGGPREDFNLPIQARVVSMNSWSSACFGSRFVSIEGRLGDIRGGLGNTAYYTGDGLHLNALGQQSVADAVYHSLRNFGQPS